MIAYNINPKSFAINNLESYLKNTEPWGINATKQGRYSVMPKPSKPYAILLAITPYKENGTHSSHASAAFVYGDTLYYFNPWGKDGLSKDFKIADSIRKKHRLSHVIMYNGDSLQYDDFYGVCSGYSSNFILEMALLAYKNEMSKVDTQQKYDSYLHKKLRSRGVCFGGKCTLCASRFTAESDLLHRRMIRNLYRDAQQAATPVDLKKMTAADIKRYAKARFNIEMTRDELARSIELAKQELRNMVSPIPRKAPAPKKVPTPRGLADQRLKNYKQLVRNRTGVKRVTKQAQIALWNKLSNKNKEQFGTWKPEGV